MADGSVQVNLSSQEPGSQTLGLSNEWPIVMIEASVGNIGAKPMSASSRIAGPQRLTIECAKRA